MRRFRVMRYPSVHKLTQGSNVIDIYQKQGFEADLQAE
jgi:hypothetical protein